MSGAAPVGGMVGGVAAAPAPAGGMVGGVDAGSVVGTGADVAGGDAGVAGETGKGIGVTGPSAGIARGGRTTAGGGVLPSLPSITISNDEIGAESETGAGSSDGIAAAVFAAFSSSGRYMPSSDARNGLPAASAASAARRIHTTASRRSPRAQSALAVDKPQTTSSESSDRGSGSFTECSAITCPLP